MKSLLDMILGWFGRRKEMPPPPAQQNTGILTSETVTPDISSPAQNSQFFAEDQTMNSTGSGSDYFNDTAGENSDNSSSDSGSDGGSDSGGYDSGGGWDSGGGGGWS